MAALLAKILSSTDDNTFASLAKTLLLIISLTSATPADDKHGSVRSIIIFVMLSTSIFSEAATHFSPCKTWTTSHPSASNEVVFSNKSFASRISIILLCNISLLLYY